MINITQAPYNADPSGGTDCTSAFNQAFDDLDNYITGSSPNQYLEGGGTIYVPKGKFKISAPIKLSTGMRLIGDGMEATTIFTDTQDIDLVRIQYPSATILDNYTTNYVSISDLTLNGNNKAISGFTNRGSQPIVSSNFKNIHIRGCKKTGFHILSGWNNLFEAITIRDVVIGFIGEVSKTPTGSSQDKVNQGFNNNTFINIITNFTWWGGGLLWGVHGTSLTVGSKCVSNVFFGCNFEAVRQIADKTYDEYTKTQHGYNGKAFGIRFAGACWSNSIIESYIEDIGVSGGAKDGSGVFIDSHGLNSDNGIPYLERSAVVNCFFNADMAHAVYLSNSAYAYLENNKIHGPIPKVTIENEVKATFLQNQLMESISSKTGNYISQGANYDTAFEQFGLFDKNLGTTSSKVNKQIDVKFNTEDYRFSEKWLQLAGVRALRYFARSGTPTSYTEANYLNVRVYPNNTDPQAPSHGTLGMPKNIGSFTIPNGTSGFYEVTNNAMQDGDFVMVNVNGSANGISGLWVEKTAWNKFKAHFSGTSSGTPCTYLFIHSE